MLLGLVRARVEDFGPRGIERLFNALDARVRSILADIVMRPSFSIAVGTEAASALNVTIPVSKGRHE